MRLRLAKLTLVLAALVSSGPAVLVSAATSSDQTVAPSLASDTGLRLAAGRRTPRNPKPAPTAAPSTETTQPPATTPPAYDPLAPLPPVSPDLTTPVLPPLPPATTVTAPDSKPQHTIDNCMKLWDADTHMTRAQWRATCRRSLNQASISTKVDAPKKKSRLRRRHHPEARSHGHDQGCAVRRACGCRRVVWSSHRFWHWR